MNKFLGLFFVLSAALSSTTMVAKKTDEEKKKIAGACKKVLTAVTDLAVNPENEDEVIKSIGDIFCGALQLVSAATRSPHYRSIRMHNVEALVALIMADNEIRTEIINQLKQRRLCAA